LSASRPTILCIVDKPNWAHCRKTDALARALSDRYAIIKRYEADVTALDIEGADCILLYYWLQFARLGSVRKALVRRKDRLLVGVCSHFELAQHWRASGIAFLRKVPRGVFANNQALVDELSPLLGRRVYYTPNGVDTDFFRPSEGVVERPADAPLRVGWAGSLTNQTASHRGVDEFIAPAVQAVPNAVFALAAREDKWLSREEMLEFYHSIDVYVCASLTEGTPNPCLEASACGVPVVTTPVGNMPQRIESGESGFLVARDVAAIAEKLTLLKDPALRARLGRAARSAAEAWDWRHHAERYPAMFEDILRSPRQRGRLDRWVRLYRRLAALARPTVHPSARVVPTAVSFCTLAIHAPYRRRARRLCKDTLSVPWFVLTDDPDDFSDMPVHAVRHAPTGPMATDYFRHGHLERGGPAQGQRAAAAYHDKRFALQLALEAHDTAIFFDADSRVRTLPPLGMFPPGISVLPVVQRSIAEHLETCGSWRLPAFVELAIHLCGTAEILKTARWCHESCIAITKNGRESDFFDAWGRAADFLQARNHFSGEGGVLGLAAACANWTVDYQALTSLGRAIRHEGGGPKKA
jgi:glycosyltransferase involved in cell wall biosynthesis